MPLMVKNRHSNLFPPHLIFAPMAKQSTRHSYKSRRERNAIAGRRAKQILLFAILLGLLLILRNWREHWAYLETYFNGL